MTKAEYRIHYKKLRSELSDEEIDEKSLAIANNLLDMDIWRYHYYHIFLTILKHREINTDYILNILAGKDKHIIISKSDFKTSTMSHFLLTDNTIINENDLGIPEPIDGIEISNENLEVVFVPLLAFDETGNRIGYGKGFYDRFLAECKPETLKIGLSFFEAEPEFKELHERDLPLDFCVTPERVYSF